jgi:pyruvate/2-oxoglutarate dehydrogenase complex dihydrolipoamide acyltransferase (E2) component
MAHRIDMPSVGQTTDELVIVEWLKKEGDVVALGESLFSVQTDKAQVEVESIAAGTLLKVVRDAGETVRAGSAVAYIGTPGEVVPEGGDEKDLAVAANAHPATEVPSPSPGARTESERRVPTNLPGKVSALPAARRLANELGIDLNAVAGTGQDDVITVRDVERVREVAGD